jgi:hypothetical protein
VLAIVTAVFAFLAFRKQSREVSDQAKMLEVQSDQLGEDRTVNAEQIRVLKLQAEELRESLDERKHEAEDRRRAQASRVFIWEERGMNRPANVPPFPGVTAHVANSSDQPVYDAELVWRRGADLYGSPNPQPLPTIMPVHRHPSRREPEFRARTPADSPDRRRCHLGPPTPGRKGNADRSPVSDSRPLNGYLSACRRM